MLVHEPSVHSIVPAQHDHPQDIPLVHLSDESISSLSVWYQDVYQRHYRSRITIKYRQSAPQSDWEIQRLDVEFMSPQDSSLSLHPPNAFISMPNAEHGRGFRARPNDLSPALLRLDGPPRVSQTRWDGNDVTFHRTYRILDWGFCLDIARPQFTLEVESFEPCIIGLKPDYTDAPRGDSHPFLMAPDTFAVQRIPSTPHPLIPGLDCVSVEVQPALMPFDGFTIQY